MDSVAILTAETKLSYCCVEGNDVLSLLDEGTAVSRRPQQVSSHNSTSIMGCNDSRKGYSQEELVLEAKEAELLFYTKPCDELLRSFTWHAQKDVITANALAEALGELSLPQVSANEGLKLIFDGFHRSGDDFDLRKVQLLCILLGAPKGDAKARCLFKLYDSRDELSLSVTTIAQLCHDLITVSIEDLGKLDSSSRVKNYLAGLREVRDDFVQEMVKKVAGDAASLSRDQFLTAMNGMDTIKYQAAGSLRAAMAHFKKESSIAKFARQARGST